MDRQIYEPDLGLKGTVKEFVDWANRYTDFYSDKALERIAELAKEENLEEKYCKIPLLLKDERHREETDPERETVPYERMKIDWLLDKKFGYSRSLYGADSAELEIYSENDVVIISLLGADDDGTYIAAGKFSIDEFMAGEYNWLESAIGQTIFYGKEYTE